MTDEVRKAPLLLAAVVMLTVGLSACNTVKGAGQDIEGAGGAISETASDVQDDMKDK